MIPKDPVMRLSFVNLKLRDFYNSLEELCEDLNVDENELKDSLAAIDYHYDKEKNHDENRETLCGGLRYNAD